jgi:hypothetical protein
MDQLYKAKEYLVRNGIVEAQIGIVLGTDLKQLLSYMTVKKLHHELFKH